MLNSNTHSHHEYENKREKKTKGGCNNKRIREKEKIKKLKQKDTSAVTSHFAAKSPCRTGALLSLSLTVLSNWETLYPQLIYDRAPAEFLNGNFQPGLETFAPSAYIIGPLHYNTNGLLYNSPAHTHNFWTIVLFETWRLSAPVWWPVRLWKEEVIVIWRGNHHSKHICNYVWMMMVRDVDTCPLFTGETKQKWRNKRERRKLF